MKWRDTVILCPCHVCGIFTFEALCGSQYLLLLHVQTRSRNLNIVGKGRSGCTDGFVCWK